MSKKKSIYDSGTTKGSAPRTSDKKSMMIIGKKYLVRKRKSLTKRNKCIIF